MTARDYSRFHSVEAMLEYARLPPTRWPRLIYAANVDALTDRGRALALLRRLATLANGRLLLLPDSALTETEWGDVEELRRCRVRSYGVRNGEEGFLLLASVTRTDTTGAVVHEMWLHEAIVAGLIYWSQP